MFTKISFRNVVFIVLCVIFTLYAIDVIDINPKLIPLLLIVSIYLLTCKNWNIFSKENREEFSEDEKGTLVIPGNLKVAGKLIVDENARFAKQIDTNSLYVTSLMNSGSLNVRGDTTIEGKTECKGIVDAIDKITTKDLEVTSIYSNTKYHPDVNIQNKAIMNGKVFFNDDMTLKDGKEMKFMNKAKAKFGAGERDNNDTAAGVIVFNTWDNSLNIVGTGTSGRRIKIWGDLTMVGTFTVPSINTRNLTSTWGTGGGGAGIVKIARLQVDQLSGYAWGDNSDKICIIRNKLVFKTAQHKDILEITKVPSNEGNTDDQSMVKLNNSELRIINNDGRATHFNHKTFNSWYGNWLRGNFIHNQ